GVEDQPIVQTSQHPEWFSQPRKPPTPDRDWNKNLPADVYKEYRHLTTCARSSTGSRKLPEEAQPYQARHIDELHKFSDGTLNDVRNALDDRLKGIRMRYLPQTIWRKGDKDRAAAMIQAIDKMLKTRRIMRSLERFVRGRLYEGDFRMLQRTI
nr:hypothetical protein [Tanacetum cinerariifolium]GFB34836.1 hypothetical protein [Tanacetum cinerariifolium]